MGRGRQIIGSATFPRGRGAARIVTRTGCAGNVNPVWQGCRGRCERGQGATRGSPRALDADGDNREWTRGCAGGGLRRLSHVATSRRHVRAARAALGQPERSQAGGMVDDTAAGARCGGVHCRAGGVGSGTRRRRAGVVRLRAGAQRGFAVFRYRGAACAGGPERLRAAVGVAGRGTAGCGAFSHVGRIAAAVAGRLGPDRAGKRLVVRGECAGCADAAALGA